MSALERSPGLSHTLGVWSVESGEQFPLLSCAGRQIVSLYCPLTVQLHWWTKIEPQTKSSSQRNKTLVKLMNHLVSRTRSFTPVSSTAGGGGGAGGDGSYGRMTRRGSLSCPSLVHGEPLLPPPALSIISSLFFFFFKEVAKLDERSMVFFQRPNMSQWRDSASSLISSCLVSLDCEVHWGVVRSCIERLMNPRCEVLPWYFSPS